VIFERRLLTESRGAGLVSKLWRVPWLFVLLLVGIAAIGYVALWTAGSGNADAYAQKHALRFGFCLVIMLSIAFIDIRIILRFAWVGYAFALGLLVLVLFSTIPESAETRFS
jgi:rod shape determining protein RodA